MIGAPVRSESAATDFVVAAGRPKKGTKRPPSFGSML
jgi:hypothetical protein